MNWITTLSAATMILTAGSATSGTAAAPIDIEIAAESHDMIWNAVAVDYGRVFVAGPRWTGSKGPSLALIDGHGIARPYPSPQWNGWTPGAANGTAFVNVNAIHLDGKGGLWAVDTGSPEFGGDPLPDAAKLVRIDLATDRVDRVIPLGPAAALAGSYIDDIRFNGDHAYLTDAGRPGLIVLDLRDGSTRRVLEGHGSVTARPDRDIFLDGQPLTGPDGKPLYVHSDPLEVSPDGKWLHYGPLEGPWSRIETRFLDDASLSQDELAAKVEPWADLPPVGGTVMDSNGDLYFADLAANALRKRAADGTVTTLLVSPELHWVDAPFIDTDHVLWLPVPQIDRAALFNGGISQIRWPIRLFRLPLGTRP